jgi:hypothetical protein
MGDDPNTVHVLWETGGADGTYYSLGDGKVHLKDQDAASRDTVVHEANHSYMHDLYSGSWPCFDCTSPHYINRASGCCCGWSEGYTYMVVAAADGNPDYTWPSGAWIDLEAPHCETPTSQWDRGPEVEGRVGGTLIDLMDPVSVPWGTTVTRMTNGENHTACNGRDLTTGYVDVIWDLISDQNDDVFVVCGGHTNSYSRAWQARQYQREYPKVVGNLNTIYTFVED